LKYCHAIIKGFLDEYGSSHANPMVVDDTLINNGNFHGEYLAKGEIKT